MSLHEDHSWTYERLCLLPDDGLRHEIIDGEHFVTAAPRIFHQVVLSRLYESLRSAAPGGLVLFAPCDLVLSDRDVVEPDLFWVSEERSSIVRDTHLTGAPDLVVEVLSPSTRRTDEHLKRDLYERFGVREYWIVDPDVETVDQYRLVDERFAKPLRISRSSGDALSSELLGELALPLEKLFAAFR